MTVTRSGFGFRLEPLVACLCSLGLLLVVSGCGRSSGDALNEAQGELLRVVSTDAGPVEWARGIRAIDLTGCPQDYREAVLAAVAACEECVLADAENQRFQQRQSGELASNMVESFVRGAAGDPYGRAVEVVGDHRRAEQSLRRTYDRYLDALARCDMIYDRHFDE